MGYHRRERGDILKMLVGTDNPFGVFGVEVVLRPALPVFRIGIDEEDLALAFWGF